MQLTEVYFSGAASLWQFSLKVSQKARLHLRDCDLQGEGLAVGDAVLEEEVVPLTPQPRAELDRVELVVEIGREAEQARDAVDAERRRRLHREEVVLVEPLQWPLGGQLSAHHLERPVRDAEQPVRNKMRKKKDAG